MSFARRCSNLSMVAALISMAAVATAQEARGRITGRVVDPSKGSVSGASVKVTDVARGTTFSATTGSDGLFQFNYLVPGTYQLAVESAGFKKYIREKVSLDMNETRDVPISLEVGGVEETITVSTANVTSTADANLGLTIDARRLADLPLIHGDPYKLMGLAAGLTHTGDQRLDRPFEPTHIIGYAMDGTRGNRSDLLIDGAPSTATANSGAGATNAFSVIATYVPPSDLVEEFKVQTATFDAQFGNTEGGVTSIAIKSGTNRFHGSAYGYFEPYQLGANDFFGKAAVSALNPQGQPRIQSHSNRPGFTLTGPIVADKTFFTVGWEMIKDARPRFDANQNSWIPTQAMQNGDMSAYLANVQIYDPLTRVQTSPGVYTAQPFPNNIIPANRISPVAKAILGFYGLPKTSGLLGNISDATLAEKANYNTVTARIDEHFSSKNRMFIRGSYYKRDSHYDDYTASAPGAETLGGYGIDSVNFQFISYQAVIDDVHVFNPTTVLNLRYGYNRFERNSGPELPFRQNFDLAQLGFPTSYNTLIPDPSRGFPRLDFPTNTMLGNGQANDFRPITSHTVSATLNKTLSAHAVKLGAEMRIYREDSLPTWNSRSGEYTFNNTYTRQTSTGSTASDWNGVQAYASFLLGMPSTSTIVRASDFSEYSKTWGYFVQDDWRVNDKLTLNLGLRYEVETPLAERQDKSASGLDFTYVQPIQSQVQTKYNALNDPTMKALVPQINVQGGLMFAGKDGPDALYTAPKNTWLPRFGFAYQLDHRTVIRGGAGLFAGFLGQRRGDVSQPGYTQTTTEPTTTNQYGAPVPYDIATALLQTPILEPVGNTLGRQTNLGQNITFFNPNPKASKQLRYQIGFQHQFSNSLVLEVAYVGNTGKDIEITRNLNATPIQFLNGDNSITAAMTANNKVLTTAVTNPFAGLLPGTGLNNGTINRASLVLPYPGFGGTMNTTNNDGKAWYNSLQANLQKRFSQGVTLGITYTYSHWMQQTEYLNAADPLPTKMISDLDVPHRLAASAIYELPFGKSLLLGGWQVQGVYTFQSGFPVAFSTDLFYNGTDPVNGSDIKMDNPTTQQWFNTGVFTSVLNGGTSANATPLNHLRSLPLRFDDVRRQAISNLNVSLLKNVRLGGEAKLRLQLDFINALNHPYFPAPTVNPTASNFGSITGATQANYARRGQVSVKLLF